MTLGAGPRALPRLLLGLAALTAAVASIRAGSPDGWIFRDGRRQAEIRIAADATPAERTAARELARYLRRSTGVKFPVRCEERKSGGTALYVGWTQRAAAELDPAALGSEEWIVRRSGPDLLLVGGRPRGTLYAVYHFLEDQLGIRWWTPFDERVPHRERLRVPQVNARGEPAFRYRDVYGIQGPRQFSVRNRLNGHHADLGPRWGDAWRWGPPKVVHDFDLYVPPYLYFDEHPEYFSEIGGLRDGERSQLCLTNAALGELVGRRLEAYVAAGEKEARAAGRTPPPLYDFSQNDWGRDCRCPVCSELSRREGARSAPLVQFVNRLAAGLEQRHPELLLTTLAYGFSFEPPRELRVRDNVVIRLAALYQRDFSKPVSDPVHQAYRDALAGWAQRTRHLWVWDYAVTFGEDGDLPLPNLGFLAEDYRLYHAYGVEGLNVQHDTGVTGDLHDLKLWVLVKLLEDPYRDPAALVRDFTDGYYGAAGAQVRRYVRLLERSAAEHPARISFAATAADFSYVDLGFVRAAHAIFDEAEALVRNDPERLARVRHARLTLDLVTLLRWSRLEDERRAELGRGGAARWTLTREELLQRARATWLHEVRRRLRGHARREARREARLYLDWFED